MRYLRFVLLSVFAICATVVAENPIPFINQPLMPDSAQPGGKGFTLTINGAGFVSGATVHWNEHSLPTTFVSGTQLTAAVPRSDISHAQTATITVGNPRPGGGSSNPVFFPVRRPAKSVALQENALGNVSVLGGSIAVADFNGDGILDFANCDYDVAVSLGNGDGTFKAPSIISQMNCNGKILAGDFNGDGKVDLAVLQDDVLIFLGNGDGTFQNAIDTGGLPLYTWSFTAGDFNRDGKLDLAIGGLDSDNFGVVILLFGKGDGTFRAPKEVRVNNSGSNGVGVVYVATADINHDGNLDLAVVSQTSINHRAIFALLGQGDGSFKVLPRVGSGYGDLALADVNGDGNLDMVSDVGDIVVRLGNGDGTFDRPVGYKVAGGCCGDLVVGDFNGDGIPDIGVARDNYPGDPFINVLRGVGDGTFEPDLKFTSSLYTGGYLAIGDFNDDGKLDFLMSSSPDFGGVDVYLQEPK
jgi:hypothetical protein